MEGTTGSQIFLYERGIKRQINWPGTNAEPSQYNGQIAWHSYASSSSANSEIVFYNGTFTIQITNTSQENLEPSIHNGQIAWWQRTAGPNSKIRFYDGVRITDITDGTKMDAFPQLDNGKIIWERAADIYFWDGQNIFQLTNRGQTGGSHWSPQIFDTKASWVYRAPNNTYNIDFVNLPKLKTLRLPIAPLSQE
jgi:hypothetical protein